MATTDKQEFTWFPDASIDKSSEPAVHTAKFGDGYEQRAPVGITPILPVWSVTFTGLRSHVDPIEAFLKAHGGWKSFLWKDPDEETGLFVCRKWSKNRERGVIVKLTAEFERVVL